MKKINSPEQRLSRRERAKIDIPSDSEVLKNRMLNQDSELMQSVNALANKIKSMPHDPEHADVEPRALLVGGFVRDAAMAMHPMDADLEVYGISADRLEQLLNQMFHGKVDVVGKSFGIFLVRIDEDRKFDVAIPRRESKTGAGHKGFSVEGDPSMSLTEASRRRDFTMNTLAADPLTGEIFDPHHGLDDLQNHTLRITDEKSFQEDPLRVYRGLQFAARFDLRADPKTKKLMRSMIERGDLDELAPERVTKEIQKLLMSEKPSIGFKLARELGITEKYFPELHATIGIPQDKDWHPEGDVWVHTMMVTDAAAKLIHEKGRDLSDNEKLQVMLGALVHDLGKPVSTTTEGGRIRSKGHEEAGIEPTKQMLGRMTFHKDTNHAAIAITADHLKPRLLYHAFEKGKMTDAQYTNAVRKLIKKISPTNWRVFLLASEADLHGRGLPDAATTPDEAGEKFAETVIKNKLDEDPKKPLIRGNDMILKGLKPGPRFGVIIGTIEKMRDEGRIKSREEALQVLDTLI